MVSGYLQTHVINVAHLTLPIPKKWREKSRIKIILLLNPILFDEQSLSHVIDDSIRGSIRLWTSCSPKASRHLRQKKKQSFERKEYVSKWQCVDKVANYSVAFYSYFIFLFLVFNKKNETIKTRYSQK